MYQLTNVKWGAPVLGTPSGTITWSDDLDGLASPGGATAALDTALSAAFQAWEDVAAVNFREVSGSADITVQAASFSTDSVAANDGAVGTAFAPTFGTGLAEPLFAEIEFNSDYSWSPFADSDPDTMNFFAVALHEIGHVIGLGHPWEIGDPISARDNDLIMNAILTADDLGEGDKAGAQALYGLDGDDEPAEESSNNVPLADGGDGGGGGGGIILGLLAMLVGLFTGGIGAAPVLAAAKVMSDDDHDHVDLHGDHDHDNDHHGDHHHDGDHLHVLYLPQIPVEEFEHTRPQDEHEDDLFLF
ncbi:MAG: matrixin family metalloprotease [Silicimonas sp.]|nr:matrixin family metalloprotease [Silicimonas sp.]